MFESCHLLTLGTGLISVEKNQLFIPPSSRIWPQFKSSESEHNKPRMELEQDNQSLKAPGSFSVVRRE